MNVLNKIIKGGSQDERTTRFHDETNVFMGAGGFVQLPHALYSTLMRLAVGVYPKMPWWPYSAIKRIEGLLTPDAVVLEYGSGSSTLWLAKRARKVHSIEGAPGWHRQIDEQIRRDRVANVEYVLRDSTAYPDRGHYSHAFNEAFASADGLSNAAFDLVIVDGAARWRCVEVGLSRLKPGGYLYLDNSDADKDWCHYLDKHSAKEAQKILRRAAAEGRGTIEEFRGLTPGNLCATAGMLFHLTGPARSTERAASAHGQA